MTAQITFTGNATHDAELKFLPSGVAVANVTVAVTPREKVDGQWVDGEAAFYRVAAWREMAENVAESVKRGNRVTVVGRLKVRSFEHNGEKRMSLEVDADSIALDLRFATATATKAQRQSTAQTGHHWAATEPAQPAPTGGGWGGAPSYDEPPF